MLDYCESDNQYLQRDSNMLYGTDIAKALLSMGKKIFLLVPLWCYAPLKIVSRC